MNQIQFCLLHLYRFSLTTLLVWESSKIVKMSQTVSFGLCHGLMITVIRSVFMRCISKISSWSTKNLSLFSNCFLSLALRSLLECPTFRTVCHRPPVWIFPVEVFLRTSMQEESLVVASDILGRPQREMDYPWRRNNPTIADRNSIRWHWPLRWSWSTTATSCLLFCLVKGSLSNRGMKLSRKFWEVALLLNCCKRPPTERISRRASGNSCQLPTSKRLPLKVWFMLLFRELT